MNPRTTSIDHHPGAKHQLCAPHMFSFGHVRQLDAVGARFLTRLAAQAPLIATSSDTSERVMVDVDDTIIEVHGYAKQGSGYGYSGVRGLNALLAFVSTTKSAPVIVARRLRKGSCGSPRGAKRLVADALKTATQLSSGGADVSVTVRMDPKVKAAIATIGDDAWTPIEYTDAVFDQQSQTWVSRAEVAEVAEIPFTAFTSKQKAERVSGRLVVRRSPDLNRPGRTGRPRCSTPGASTRSSPPQAPTRLTPWPRTRPTALTRSSNKSTPT